MHNIVVDYTTSYIEPRLSGDVLTRLRNKLRYHPAGYQHTWYFKRKEWDGYNHTFDLVNQSFRTGLLWRVGMLLEREKIDFQIQDMRGKYKKISCISNINLGKIKPYNFQLEAANATIMDTHGIVASPTGTGKTIIMALMARYHGGRTLIVVNSRTLLDQTFEFFDAAMPGGAGIVGSGDFELKDLTIATIQSLSTILRLGDKQKTKPPTAKEAPLRDWLDHVNIVIQDEVHEADSASVGKLYIQLKVDRFIGTTATPYAWAHSTEKGKNLELEQHFGRKIYDSRGMVDFNELGITVPLVINRVPMPRIEEFQDYTGEQKGKPVEDYNYVVQNQVIDNEERTEKIVKLASDYVEAGQSCYVFYSKIKFGEQLTEAMSHMDPVMLQGSTSRGKRRDIFKDLQNKKQLLVISDIGSYGLNIPSLNSIIIASPTKDARQLKGRVCRASPGKEHGMVIDLMDNVPYLKRHSSLRHNQYKKDGDLVVG